MKKIIAFGAENKTCFSVKSDKDLYISAPVEDLKDLGNFNRYENAIKGYLKDNRIYPELIACDMHPDYRSSSLAEEIHAENKGSVLLKVQHHHAHIASCMEDNGLDEKVIGVSFDGTGYGADGKSWGGEFLICTRRGFSREYHLKYVPQPGGDIASREAWRLALAYLFLAYGDGFDGLETELLRRLDKNKVAVIKQMMKKDINCPETSSMGRLFDAVSSLIGVCDVSSFEAEGAVLLEKIAKSGEKDRYGYNIDGGDICVSEMIKSIVEDLARGIDKSVISAKFHNTVSELIFDVSDRIYGVSGVDKVVVSGGCFLNEYIMHRIKERFAVSHLKLFVHRNFSPSDLGLSVGQAAVAAAAVSR